MWYNNRQRLFITIAICMVAAIQFVRGEWQSALLFLGCAGLFGWSYWKTKTK